MGVGFNYKEDYDGEGYYNPYKHDCFIDKVSGVKLMEAEMVYFHDNTFHYKNKTNPQNGEC